MLQRWGLDNVRCRYQVDFAGPQFAAMSPQQHINYALTVEKPLYQRYLAKGGLPPVFGEWALAGKNLGPHVSMTLNLEPSVGL